MTDPVPGPDFKIPFRSQLDALVERYNHIDFIPEDPISIPHRYHQKHDIEIAGFFAAIFAWGQRKTIISKCDQLMVHFDDAPYQFILGHEEEDLGRLATFVHRTFQPDDLLYFIRFLRWHYERHESLETAFSKFMEEDDLTVEKGLNGFYQYFFSLPEHLSRTRKHIAAPFKKSTCKRLNMFLRWMVRRDDAGVDFGIWNNIRPSQLCIPLDVHVERIARRYGLLQRKQKDWSAVLELSDELRKLDPEDPVKYDFALFGMSIAEKKPG